MLGTSYQPVVDGLTALASGCIYEWKRQVKPKRPRRILDPDPSCTFMCYAVVFLILHKALSRCTARHLQYGPKTVPKPKLDDAEKCLSNIVNTQMLAPNDSIPR